MMLSRHRSSDNVGRLWVRAHCRSLLVVRRRVLTHVQAIVWLSSPVTRKLSWTMTAHWSWGLETRTLFITGAAHTIGVQCLRMIWVQRVTACEYACPRMSCMMPSTSCMRVSACPHTLHDGRHRAISHDKLGNSAAAIAGFSAALELDPSNTSAYFNRGTCYDSLGQHDLATADFGRALELDFPSGQAKSGASQDAGTAGAEVVSARD